MIPLNERMSESDPANSLDPKTARIHVTAGPHRVSAAFIQRFEAPLNDLLIPIENTLADVSMSFGVTLLPHLRDMTVQRARTRVTGVSDSVSRRLIFTCRPTTAAEEPACASQIVRSLAGRAFRGAGAAGRPRHADGLLPEGPQEGRLRARHPLHAAGHPRQPALRVPPRGSAGDDARRPDASA